MLFISQRGNHNGSLKALRTEMIIKIVPITTVG